MKLKQYIGDAPFYKMVFAIALPIMVQNGITNFVNMLDNIMVGRIGTEQYSGVAIVNQLLFVFSLCIFGGFSGAGIFTAQYFGKGDAEGVRHSVRYKLYMGVILTALAIGVLYRWGDPLVATFLHESDAGGDLALTLAYGKDYLQVMLWGLLPFAITQMYASTLRETGNAVVPMNCGLAAVLINLLFNYLLIYGKLGCPELGVKGAAIATVLSRYVECLAIVIWTHRHTEKHPFMRGLYRSLRLPLRVTGQITLRGLPLLANETLWSLGITMLSQCFATRGLEVVSAYNISSTLSNVCSIVFMALGSSISIIVGNLLGASRMEEARDTDRKLIAFTLVSSFMMGGLMALMAPVFPRIYKTDEGVRSLATFFIVVMACYLPINAYINALYFTIRSGGKTLITFVFDSLYVWVVSVPLAYVLTRYTTWEIYPIFIVTYAVDLIKCVIGTVLVRSGKWMHNFVGAPETGTPD